MQKPAAPIEPDDLLKTRLDMGQHIVEGLPTTDECLSIYKMLGPTRSMSKIQIYLKNQGRKVPAVTTLKKYSIKHKWRLHASEYDIDIARRAEEKIKEASAEEAAEDLSNLAKKMRTVSGKILKQLDSKISNLKIASAGEARAAAEAAVLLNKAAEVLDGGVSDRTESRETLTIEEKKSAAEKLVDDAFRNIANGGNDNGRRKSNDVADAANARKSAGVV